MTTWTLQLFPALGLATHRAGKHALSVVLSLNRCLRGHEPMLHAVSGKYNSVFYLGIQAAEPRRNRRKRASTPER